MKKIFSFLTAITLAAVVNGCVSSSPEYYEELTEKEHAALQHTARALALRSNAVPGHLQNAFMKLAPLERIIYDGDKRGKASFRWEIYEKRRTGVRLTQKDINPYWVIVYAIGDLRDPSWKLSHANQGTLQPASAVQPDKQQKWQVNRVRYKN